MKENKVMALNKGNITSILLVVLSLFVNNYIFAWDNDYGLLWRGN